MEKNLSIKSLLCWKIQKQKTNMSWCICLGMPWKLCGKCGISTCVLSMSFEKFCGEVTTFPDFVCHVNMWKKCIDVCFVLESIQQVVSYSLFLVWLNHYLNDRSIIEKWFQIFVIFTYDNFFLILLILL